MMRGLVEVTAYKLFILFFKWRTDIIVEIQFFLEERAAYDQTSLRVP